jgi:hypothetical protein
LQWKKPCPLYPQKRTLRSATKMSALCQKQTKCIAATATSFNHIICSDEHCFRYAQVRTAATPPSQRARRAGQVSALHSPVLIACSASIIWTHAYHSRANSSSRLVIGAMFGYDPCGPAHGA